MKCLTNLLVFLVAIMATLTMALPQPIANGPNFVVDTPPHNLTKRQLEKSEIKFWQNTICIGDHPMINLSDKECDVKVPDGHNSYKVTSNSSGCWKAYSGWDANTQKCTGILLGQLFQDWCGVISRRDHTTIQCFHYTIWRDQCFLP